MSWNVVRAAALALACGFLGSAAPAQAALVLTAPAQVTPGVSFEATLSLTETLTPTPPDVLDLIDITLTYDPGVLQFDSATPIGLLDSPNVDPVPGEFSFFLFYQPPESFGPGDLLRYRFTVLPGQLDTSTALSASATPFAVPQGVGGKVPLANWADANATVQIVPEPSSWLLLAAGLGGLIVLRARALRAARVSSRRR